MLQPQRIVMERFRRWVPVAGLAAMVCFGMADTAKAQVAPRVEIGAGTAALVRGDFLPQGLYVSTAVRLNRRFALVGEAGWHRKHETLRTSGGSTSEQEISSFLGGGRFVPWRSNRTTLFAEVLVGPYRERSHVEEQGARDGVFPRFDVTIQTRSVALQPGGGLLFWFTPRVGGQLMVHYRRTFSRAFRDCFDCDDYDLSDWHEVRFGAGLTVAF
jgi:hypothetical protein